MRTQHTLLLTSILLCGALLLAYWTTNCGNLPGIATTFWEIWQTYRF